MESELKMNKCPFCKSDDVELSDNDGMQGFFVYCNSCEATGPFSLNANDAIDLWDKGYE